jgi:hypothetical protein
VKKSTIFAMYAIFSIFLSYYPAYGATVFYADNAFTPNGIEWCQENEALYHQIGYKFFEHHNHSIESRVCANLIEDPLWHYTGSDKFEKLIERSRYYSELEIAESQVEAKTGVVDPTPAEVPKPELEELPIMKENQVESENKTELTQPEDTNQNGGGCLIATATFGTELASQVQTLREIRDAKVLNTETGIMFLSGFNQFYYSFSPTIADWERQSSVFKEFVKFIITPMLASFSLLNHVDINSEGQMLGAGIGIISLNVGFYFGIPLVVALGLKRRY